MRKLQVAASLSLVFMVSTVWAQTGTSTIRGTITDQHGSVIPGATITLINTETNAVRTTRSTDVGTYVFDLITPAGYRLQVEAKGFKRQVVENVTALIGKPTESNVVLEVGTVSETVEVRAASQQSLINTEDATLGNNFNSIQITQLPLEARNLVDLLSLQPGSTREGYVTGARADQSNVTLDGVDINNAQTGNAAIPESNNSLNIGALDNDRGNITSGPVLRLNAEAIDEFRVTTANGNANQGRSSGSQVNLITKSGTNNWHGAAFEIYRSRGFTANDWFNNHSSPVVPRTPLVRNTFGGALGGPIMKNKAFFFYSYEGRHDASGQSVSRIVPLASLGTGTLNYQFCTDVSCASTGVASLDLPTLQQIFSITGINSVALTALADAASRYPANDTSQGDQLNTGGFRFNAPTPTRLNSHVGKLDFNLTNKQSAFVRANVIYDHQNLPQWLPDTLVPGVWNHPWGLAAGHTWTLGNNWVNNFRYGYTRQAFTQTGDSTGNDIYFRSVFQPNGENHDVSRITPVHNFTDDVSWVKGKHTIQFGANVRMVSNNRVSFANAFDIAGTNYFWYLNSGKNVSDAIQQYIDANNLPGAGTDTQHRCDHSPQASCQQTEEAGTAIIGRLNELQSNFTFGKDGSLLAAGTPTVRDFATQAYDQYVQDTWKLRQNLTLTLGLRYSLEKPVYETHGFQVQPTVPLGQYFAERVAAGKAGTNFVDPIVIDKSGPANGGKPMYNWDKNNFQPRIALAWSPDNKTVLRGGFAITNDYYGQALAVDWDLNNSLGFSSNFQNPPNTFDIAGADYGAPNARPLGPLFTDFNQDIRGIIPTAGGSVPNGLAFPLSFPVDNGERIESSIDSDLHAPTEYVWNFTIERELPKGALFTASYIGRMGRGLLLHRDITQFNDLRDPKNGVDWYTAGTALEKLRQKGTDITQIPALLPAKVNQYFDDMFPAGLVNVINDFEGPLCDTSWSNAQAFYCYPFTGFFSGNDWTDTQAEMDLALANDAFPTRFMQPQWGSLGAWSTIGNSNYHALALSFRERLASLTLDFNYTWSHSLDDASGLQTEGGFGNNTGNGSFVPNPIRQRDNYASSDFDVRHNINVSAVWELPFGKGRMFGSNTSRAVDAILGGWQLSSIFRWNTGLPLYYGPIDDGRWATNWDFQSYVTPTRPLHSCPDKPKNGDPKLFGACGVDQVYQSFRNAYPGETGPRNYFRLPGYVALDLGFGKAWKMPWSENHQLQLRWDVFNVTNTQRLTGIANNGVALDPGPLKLTAPPDWSNFTQIQGNPRVMQIGARYSF